MRMGIRGSSCLRMTKMSTETKYYYRGSAADKGPRPQREKRRQEGACCRSRTASRECKSCKQTLTKKFRHGHVLGSFDEALPDRTAGFKPSTGPLIIRTYVSSVYGPNLVGTPVVGLFRVRTKMAGQVPARSLLVTDQAGASGRRPGSVSSAYGPRACRAEPARLIGLTTQ